MLSLPSHLIPPLVYPEVCVCPILKFVFPTGLHKLNWAIMKKWKYSHYEIDDCSLFMLFHVDGNLTTQLYDKWDDFDLTNHSPSFKRAEHRSKIPATVTSVFSSGTLNLSPI
jgi:hypothetical protein